MILFSDAAPGEVTDFDIGNDGLDRAIVVVGGVNPDGRYPAPGKRLRRDPMVARRVAGPRELVLPAHLLGPVRGREGRPGAVSPGTPARGVIVRLWCCEPAMPP